jgi:hypothetical protein
MLSWLFKRKPPEPLAPAELRDRLIEAAASGSKKKLRALCNDFKEQVAANLDLMQKVPEGRRTDLAFVNSYFPCLVAIAQCLANECGAPQLWQRLCGTPDDNPLLKWDRWYGELRERMDRLEYGKLIEEAREFIEEARRFEMDAARQNEAFLNGRLGELLFHSGRMLEAEEPFRSALRICQDINDSEGQRVYLSNLLEVYGYLGRVAAVRSRRSSPKGIGGAG